MPTGFTPDETATSHRWHAAECNNLAWSLSEMAERSAEQDQEMLDAAHAASFHWRRVGTPLHAARADMLLGNVHAALGHGELATRYALRAHDYLMANDPPDWEVAFSHAVLARAAHAAGDGSAHREHYETAKQLGEALADEEDREIFQKTMRVIPAP